LAERAGDLHNVNIRACLSVRPRAVLEADPDAEASVAIRGLADAVVARRAGAIRKALTVL